MNASRKFSISDLIVLTGEPDATVYRIKEMSGRMIGVVDAALEERIPALRIQWLDVSLLQSLSVGQLARYSESLPKSD